MDSISEQVMCILCVFTFWVPCYDVRYDFHIKSRSGRLHLQLFVGGLMSYLRYLYLFAHRRFQKILCCVFLRLVYPMLPVSLDCSFFYWPFCILCRLLNINKKLKWPLSTIFILDFVGTVPTGVIFFGISFYW
jgi:hypothetical protein